MNLSHPYFALLAAVAIALTFWLVADGLKRLAEAREARNAARLDRVAVREHIKQRLTRAGGHLDSDG